MSRDMKIQEMDILNEFAESLLREEPIPETPYTEEFFKNVHDYIKMVTYGINEELCGTARYEVLMTEYPYCPISDKRISTISSSNHCKIM